MKPMTSKERINAAMNLQHPDRVPLMCQFSIGSMMIQLKPNPVDFWYDKNIFAEGLITLCEKFKFDGILVSLHGHSDKWGKDLLSTECIGEGEYMLTYPDRTEVHSWTDLPLVKFNEMKTMPSIEDIDIEKDIPSVINYIPVSHNLYFDIEQENMFDVFDIIYSKVGESVSIHGEITSPFDYFLDLIGYQDGLVGIIMEPEKCHAILDKYANGVRDLAVKMCDKHIDAIKISSPFAGMGFISMEDYCEFVLPYERRIIEAIRAKGVHVYIHTCGSIDDRLELMRESLTSGLECLDPIPVGNVDLEDAFKRIGNDLFIKGNIDSINSLLFADDEKAETDIRKILKTGKKMGKGFILSTACSIAPKVTEERLLMLSQLVEKYGQY
ncbi:MAG: Uroporphyrinogen decarboxylase [Prolixibacteraceae bacterium]|nr:MAG: Uroporphyrinogen decarboxylase [Prolixibacteraceae bacterium]